MTPGNQCNLAGELSNRNKGINLCFKIYQKLLVKSESLLGEEQLSQSFIIVKKGKPEMRTEEIPPQDIISMTIIFPLLKTYLWKFLRNTMEFMVSDVFTVLPLVLFFPLFL